jgi:hypothetical protein
MWKNPSFFSAALNLFFFFFGLQTWNLEHLLCCPVLLSLALRLPCEESIPGQIRKQMWKTFCFLQLPWTFYLALTLFAATQDPTLP